MGVATTSCCFLKDTKTLLCSFTLFTKGHSLFLTDLLTFLWDWFLKQLPEYELSTDLFFSSCQEVFHSPPESRKAANWGGKNHKQPILKPGPTIHLFLFISTGRVSHIFPALFTTSIFQPVHDTKQFLLAQQLISAVGIVALFSDGDACHLSCSCWWSFPDGFQYW